MHISERKWEGRLACRVRLSDDFVLFRRRLIIVSGRRTARQDIITQATEAYFITTVVSLTHKHTHTHTNTHEFKIQRLNNGRPHIVYVYYATFAVKSGGTVLLVSYNSEIKRHSLICWAWSGKSQLRSSVIYGNKAVQLEGNKCKVTQAKNLFFMERNFSCEGRKTRKIY